MAYISMLGLGLLDQIDMPPVDEEELKAALDRLVEEGLITSSGPGAEFTEAGYQYLDQALAKVKEEDFNASAFEVGCPAYELRLTLLLEDLYVWRTIKVPIDITFSALEAIIMAALGWLNVHSYEFCYSTHDGKIHYMAEPVVDGDTYMQRALSYAYGEIDEDEEWRNPANVCLFTVVPSIHRLALIYDLEYDWEIGVELMGKSTLEDGRVVCTGGEGNIPPEECGGELGYYDLLEALSDQTNPLHAEAQAWGSVFGTGEHDIEGTNARLASWKSCDLRKSLIKEAPQPCMENARYFGIFLKALDEEKLARKTAEKHIDNVHIFLNEYLSYSRSIGIEEGMGKMVEFFSDYLPASDRPLTSPTALRSMLASIKKFYKCMYDKGYVERGPYRDMLKTLKDGQAGWLDRLSRSRYR